VDQEVAKTLGELELKLQELERELTTIGHRDTEAAPRPAPSRLIDEAVEGDRDQAAAHEQTLAEGDGLGGPPLYGGEELPAQAGATVERDWTSEARETAYGEIPTPPGQPPGTSPRQPPLPGVPPGMHRSSTPGLYESPYSPDPRHSAAVEESQALDLAALVRFRDRLASTMNELIEEYSRMLPAETPERRRSDT
jgi:hypothetical protein